MSYFVHIKNGDMMYKDTIAEEWLHFGIDAYFISCLKNELRNSLIIELNTFYKGLSFDVYNLNSLENKCVKLNDIYNYSDLDYLKYLLNNKQIRGLSLIADDTNFDYSSDLDDNPLNAKSYLGIICYLISLRFLNDDSDFYIIVFNKEIKLQIKIYEAIIYILNYWCKRGFFIDNYNCKLKQILFYSTSVAFNYLNDKLLTFNNKNYLNNSITKSIFPHFNYVNNENIINIARDNNIIEHFKIIFIWIFANLRNYDFLNMIIDDKICIFFIEESIKELLACSNVVINEAFDIAKYTYLDGINYSASDIIAEINYIYYDAVITYQRNKIINKLLFIPLGIAIVLKFLKLNYFNSEYAKELNNSVSLLIYNNRDLDFCIYIKSEVIVFYNELINTDNILSILLKYQNKCLQKSEKFTKKYIFE